MGILGVYLGGRQLVNMTSQWTDLTSRVRNAIAPHEAVADVMSRLVDMADRTWSSLENTAESYLLNANALRELGYSTSQQLSFTEALNNALVISGAKGDRAASVMNALSKAIGLGKLSGENLNTVLATGGRVSEALADGLGISTLQLRKLGAEGKLTTTKVIEALVSQLEKLREEADRMPPTIADALQKIDNALLETVGRLDEATGASAAIADGLVFVAENAEALIPIIGGLATVIAVSLVPGIVAFSAALLGSPIGLAAIALGVLAGAIISVWNEQRLAAQAAEEHSAALTTNATQIEAAKTASAEFRAELRKNIEVQLAAADAALAEAEAQRKAAMTRWATGSLFDTVLSGQAWDFIVNGNEPDAPQRAAVDAASQRIADLRKQLTELDTIISTVPPGSSDKPTIPTDPTKDQIKAAKDYKKLLTDARQFIASQELEARALGMTEQAAAALRYEQELLNKAANQNIKLSPAMRNELSAVAQAMAEAEERTRKLTEAYDFGKQVFGSFFSDLKSELMNGTSLWGSFASAAAKALDSIADRALSMAANGIFDMIFGAVMGGLGGALTGSAAGFTYGPNTFFDPWGGFRAGGGDVQAGKAYIVGEQRPELFVPKTDGFILPRVPSFANQNAPSAANGNVQLTVVVQGANGGDDLETRAYRGAQRALNEYRRFMLQDDIRATLDDPFARGNLRSIA